MTARSGFTASRIIGIIAIVLGILAIIGEFGFADMVSVLGVILLIMGILILLNVVQGSTTAGVVFLVLGIVLLVGFLPIPGVIATVLRIVVGIVLILYGIMLLK